MQALHFFFFLKFQLQKRKKQQMIPKKRLNIGKCKLILKQNVKECYYEMENKQQNSFKCFHLHTYTFVPKRIHQPQKYSFCYENKRKNLMKI